jgi:L-seryl-tRNA(Ser) seleniumtransferase
VKKGGVGGDHRRELPSVDALLRSEEAGAWVARWGRQPVIRALRDTLTESRALLEAGEPVPDVEALLAVTLRHLQADRPALRMVINATGVILHTNLGRAPLAEDAARAAATISQTYSSLEYDLEAGARGSRYEHCAELISRLTGSESSLVVNNNAAAVALAINTLSRGRDVVVSRGELVEIGGRFRIPEVIERSGAFLRAVGTTNRTRVDDYRRAITPSTGLLLKIHPSNYRVQGFVEEASLDSLVGLGCSAGLPVMHDLGSGLLTDELVATLPEPSVRASVAAGADVVTWSGDKLLGGPQAGIIHGRESIVEQLRSNPLARAFRVDKMTLAALEATLRLYLAPEIAARRVPVLRMLSESAESVEERARVALRSLSPEAARRVSIAPMRSVLGGGSTPGFEIASAGWVVSGSGRDIDSRLRGQDPPVVGRIEAAGFLLDFRTVLKGQEPLVSRALDQLVEGERSGS